METEPEQAAGSDRTHWAERRYQDGTEELALGSDGPDPRRLRKAIACFEEALTVYTVTTHPQPWARVLLDLAYARWRLPGGNRAAELTAALDGVQRALHVFTESATPQDWAEAQNTLGLLLSDWAMPGTRAVNVRQAVSCFLASARVRAGLADRYDWAMTQNNLGRTLQELPGPGRAANLRQAIACYEGALSALDLSWPVPDQAIVQNNLGNALLALPTADHRQQAANLRRAADCYRAALEIHTEAGFPHHWALAQSNLGNVYVEQKEGCRDENLRTAIACYEASLRVFTEESYPFDWARIHDNLGIAYRNLASGERAAHCERAVACHQAALRIYTEAAHPPKWAQTLINLGFTYQSAPTPTDDPDRQRKLAMECFAATLRFYTAADDPIQRANALGYLAHQQRTLRTGDRTANLRQALAHYQEALRLRDAHGAPDLEWAWNQVQLAGCYRDQPAAGEARARNLEHAINHCVASLKVFTRDGSPREWAMSQNGIGKAYHCLGTELLEAGEQPSDREQSLRLAIAAYRAALEVYQEQGQDALTWADVQVNLALCYYTLTTGNRRENLARVQAGFDGALRVRTKKRHPDAWAATQQRIGVLCLDRRGWDKGNGPARAVEHFRAALTVYRGRGRVQNRAVLQTQLGVAYLDLSATGSERRRNLQRAARRFQTALGFFTPADHPWQWAWTHQNLARAYRALAGMAGHARSETTFRTKAAASFRASLTVYTAEQAPATHAGITRDLAMIELTTGSPLLSGRRPSGKKKAVRNRTETHMIPS